MHWRRNLVLSVLFLCCLLAVAKKKKPPLPVEILQAHTAWVIVDPQAGVDVTDPNANRQARVDVENALARWGRLMPVTDSSQADLIIVIRKGNGKLAQETIGHTPINAPPPVIAQRTDGGINTSARNGPPIQTADPHPQMEIGTSDDTFAVYRGDPKHITEQNPLNAPPVWRYTREDALESPSVPAVEAFRQAINDSEKALAGP